MIRIKEDHRNKRTFISIDDAPKRIRQGARIALTEIGRENVVHTKGLIMKPPKTGKFYRFKGGIHRASAPGQPPANRSGALLSSTRFRVYGWHRMEFGYHAPYGKYLEDGTSKMEARPALSRTVLEKRRDNYNSIEKNTGKLIIK